MGRRWSSRRRGCIRRGRRAFCGRRVIGGFRGPGREEGVRKEEVGVGKKAYVFRLGVALEIGLDGFVLLVELGKIRH